MKIVITGGHHTAALPVIEELRKRDPEMQIYWFGHKYSLKGDKSTTLEYKEITDLKIPFFELKAGKFYKTYDPIRLLKIPFGVFQSLYFLLKVKPCLIVSFGGYLAVPVVLAGWILRVPSITHEQTTVLGYANRLISIFAKKILVSWESSMEFFPANKVVYTGLPLRPELYKTTSNLFCVNDRLPTIYITGGKTGSHKINLVVSEILGELLKRANVIHQVGESFRYNDVSILKNIYSRLGSRKPGKYFIKEFILANEIGEVFSKCDLIISRAGAHTVREILEFGKKSILIPIPWVSHNEQYENAKILEKEGSSMILDESSLEPKTLLDAVDSMLAKGCSRGETPDYNSQPVKNIVDQVYKNAKKNCP